MSGIVTGAINGLYDLICRDEDTADGGVDPYDTDLHNDGFYRSRRNALDELEGSGIDRMVVIQYEGTSEWYPLVNGPGGKLRRTFSAAINIGYFSGDHTTETHMIMGDDEQKIAQTLRDVNNYPSLEEGCVMGYVPSGSTVQQVAEDAWVLTISIDVEIYGI